MRWLCTRLFEIVQPLVSRISPAPTDSVQDDMGVTDQATRNDWMKNYSIEQKLKIINSLAAVRLLAASTENVFSKHCAIHPM